VRRNRIGYVRRAVAEFGDLVTFRMGSRRLFLVNDPDCVRRILADGADMYHKGIGLRDARPLLGDGLLTSDGAAWNHDRRALQPFFSARRVDDFAETTVEHASQLAERWRSGEVVDVNEEMTRLTLTVLGFSLFDRDLRRACAGISRDLATMSDWAMRRMSSLAPLPLIVPTRYNLRAGAALRRLDKLASTLLDSAGDPGPDNLLEHLSNRSRPTHQARPGRDAVLTLLLAGHDTTAAALTWTWHLLGGHERVRVALQCELDRVLCGRRPTLLDVPHLTYTRKVIDETMRLYPPVWMVTRRARVAHTLAPGRVVPAGADVLVCIYTLHRHIRHWTEPDSFQPERFSEPAATRHPFAYLPFGAGPRACLGSRFALVEAVLALATLASRVELVPISSLPPRLQANLTLKPDGPLLMRIVQRTPARIEKSKVGEAPCPMRA
jgi:cytochrome P450